MKNGGAPRRNTRWSKSRGRMKGPFDLWNGDLQMFSMKQFSSDGRSQEQLVSCFFNILEQHQIRVEFMRLLSWRCLWLILSILLYCIVFILFHLMLVVQSWSHYIMRHFSRKLPFADEQINSPCHQLPPSTDNTSSFIMWPSIWAQLTSQAENIIVGIEEWVTGVLLRVRNFQATFV